MKLGKPIKVKSVDMIAFGNHRLKGHGLAMLFVGAVWVIGGVLTIGASETNFSADDETGRSMLQGAYKGFLDEVQK